MGRTKLMGRMELLFRLYRVPVLAWQCGEWRAPWALWRSLWRGAQNCPARSIRKARHAV